MTEWLKANLSWRRSAIKSPDKDYFPGTARIAARQGKYRAARRNSTIRAGKSEEKMGLHETIYNKMAPEAKSLMNEFFLSKRRRDDRRPCLARALIIGPALAMFFCRLGVRKMAPDCPG